MESGNVFEGEESESEGGVDGGKAPEAGVATPIASG